MLNAYSPFCYPFSWSKFKNKSTTADRFRLWSLWYVSNYFSILYIIQYNRISLDEPCAAHYRNVSSALKLFFNTQTRYRIMILLYYCCYWSRVNYTNMIKHRRSTTRNRTRIALWRCAVWPCLCIGIESKTHDDL